MSFKIFTVAAIVGLAIGSGEFLMEERGLQTSVFNASLTDSPYTACTTTASTTDATYAYDSCHKLLGD
jgi:hypothetical protein